MMATVPHVSCGSGLKKFQANGFLFDRVYVLCFSVDSLLAGTTDIQLKSITCTNFCIYTVYLLMMVYKYARSI